MPVVEPTVASEVLLLLHVPPTEVSAKVVVAPTQIAPAPTIAEGFGFTVTGIVTKHPVTGNVYEIDGIPDDMPVTIPVEPTVASVGLLLLQVPPVVVLPSEVTWPTQTLASPVIAAGIALTVIVVLTAQPVGKVYVNDTTPGATPVTSPELDPIVAIEVLLLVQIPPSTESLSTVVAATQTTPEPVITDG